MKTWMVCLLSVFVFASCERDTKKPGFELLPDMVHAIPYESFSANPVTKDGLTLQQPAPGSIPRGFFQTPLPDTPENRARGKQVYETFCLVCHGPSGKGDGPLIPKFPNPPSFTSKTLREYSGEKIFQIVTEGSDMMASYASQISPEDRWKLVHYVRTLQNPQLEESP